ncbi:MAG: hypothetical protein ACRD6I_18460 [Candidatus Acidiferrales bacterium]
MFKRSSYGIKRGEDHPQAKLSDADVRLVRVLHQADLGYKTIARKFEVSPSCVRNIVKGRQRGD